MIVLGVRVYMEMYESFIHWNWCWMLVCLCVFAGLAFTFYRCLIEIVVGLVVAVDRDSRLRMHCIAALLRNYFGQLPLLYPHSTAHTDYCSQPWLAELLDSLALHQPRSHFVHQRLMMVDQVQSMKKMYKSRKSF